MVVYVIPTFFVLVLLFFFIIKQKSKKITPKKKKQNRKLFWFADSACMCTYPPFQILISRSRSRYARARQDYSFSRGERRITSTHTYVHTYAVRVSERIEVTPRARIRERLLKALIERAAPLNSTLLAFSFAVKGTHKGFRFNFKKFHVARVKFSPATALKLLYKVFESRT